jgi:hypothetical protein
VRFADAAAAMFVPAGVADGGLFVLVPVSGFGSYSRPEQGCWSDCQCAKASKE